MWRSYCLAFPFLVLYVTVGALVFIPFTWLTGNILPIYWVARQGCRLGLRLSGVRMRVVNLEYAFQHPTSLFVANHVSNVEPAALFSVLPRIAVILKKELYKIPLLGYVMRLGGFIYVDRKVRDSRKHAMQQGVKTLQSGIGLMVFPEGTRSLDKKTVAIPTGSVFNGHGRRRPNRPSNRSRHRKAHAQGKFRRQTRPHGASLSPTNRNQKPARARPPAVDGASPRHHGSNPRRARPAIRHVALGGEHNKVVAHLSRTYGPGLGRLEA